MLCVYACLVQGSAQASGSPEACPPALVSPASIPPIASPNLQPEAAKILVCVGPEPITGATFEHWANVARKGGGPLKPRGVIRDVMGFLISSDWVIGEAQVLHVGVSAHAVRLTFDRIRRQQFHKQREFQAFLRKSGQNVADLLFRVKLNLLSQRIEKRIVAGHRSASSQRRLLARFVAEFKRRWQSETSCIPEYAVADCGHVQNPPL